MSAPGRPRLADVAARAGVSLKTASRALNEEYGVAPATSARVFAAARELGFRPNRLAQSLAGGGPSAAVGLLIPDVADPFVAGVVGAVERVLAAQDLQLISASHGDDAHRQHQLASALVERRVDGLLIMSAPGSVAYLQPDLAHGLVVVALDRPLEGLDADTVTVDNEAGAKGAVERLLAAGHRRIAVVALDARIWTVARRVAAYREALAAAGIPVDESLISTDLDITDARAATRRMLALRDPPTAVLATNHMAGRAAMRAMRDAGTTLDLAVFDSMDDNDLLASPPLVVVASGPDRIGQLAAELMVERLAGLQAPPRHAILAPLMLGRGERSVPESDPTNSWLPVHPPTPETVA
jgi:LacI family transcriptional regulator